MLTELPSEIGSVAATLTRLRAPWAVAGGWALDLALGRVTRPHADVDVAVFRGDQAALREALPGWGCAVARSAVLVPWAAGDWLELPVHEVHAEPPRGAREGQSRRRCSSGRWGLRHILRCSDGRFQCRGVVAWR